MREKAKAGAGNTGQGRSAAGSSQLRAHSIPNPGGGQFVWLDGRRVASVDADHVLRRTLHSGRHLYRGQGEESWSFHTPVILEAQRIGARMIEVKDADTGLRYSVDLDTFTRRAMAINNDWGPQLALPLRLWQIVNPPKAEPMQLSLFGGAL